MSYQVLARKFRPHDFAHVSGQEQVTRTLGNAIKRGKIAHAFLFCGPRGVGKTSVARVLSKALNCLKGPTAEPCLECSNCREITEGRSLGVLEIDGASHNSVDNVRELIDTLRGLPPPGYRYKVYIIDEVHMLSIAAFNALLKSLEEPPPHTVFILATTEVHKIPDTVISRCQRYDFRALTPELIEARLREIARLEQIDAEPEVLRMVARLADGSMRDGQSLLDRVQSFSDGKLTAADASQALGVAQRGLLLQLSGAIFGRDSAAALSLVQQAFSVGLDPKLFLDDFASHWRDILLAKFGGEKALAELGINQEVAVELQRQVSLVGTHDVQDLVHLAREGADGAMRSAFPKYMLEALVVRMSTREPVAEIGKILGAMQKGSSHAVAASVQSANRPAVAPIKAAPAVAPAASPVVAMRVPAAPATSSLDWRAFVNSTSGAALICENLKRLSVTTFAPGVLVAQGPRLSVDYLLDAANHEKLVNLLNNFEAASKWSIKLERSAAGTTAAPSSLADQDNKERVRAEKSELRDAAQHPAIESLRKVFPGSTLEKSKTSSRGN